MTFRPSTGSRWWESRIRCHIGPTSDLPQTRRSLEALTDLFGFRNFCNFGMLEVDHEVLIAGNYNFIVISFLPQTRRSSVPIPQKPTAGISSSCLYCILSFREETLTNLYSITNNTTLFGLSKPRPQISLSDRFCTLCNSTHRHHWFQI